MLTGDILRKMEFHIKMPTRLPKFAKHSNLLRCKWHGDSPMLKVGGLTATLRSRGNNSI